VRRHLANVYRLGVKELWSLWRDPMMLVLIVYTFTISVYTAATAAPETLQGAAIAIVDEDGSPLSSRIASAYYPPRFTTPARLTIAEVDPGLDAGDYTYVLDIPPNFQRDVLAGRTPQLQLNVDATRIGQAFAGAGLVQVIAMGEVAEFVQRYRSVAAPPVDLALRARFNPALRPSWFISLMEVVSHVTMLSIILTGAALIREREHGTVEHLLVMPVTPAEIMLAKMWSMGAVVLLATSVSLNLVIRGALDVPIEGSIALFLVGASLHLFAATAIAIFMATLARTMPQFGLLIMLVLLPMQLLSGGSTPRESMPTAVRNLMLLSPTTHFTELSQAILYRGAGLDVVWRPFAALVAIGAVFFLVSLARFRKTIGQLA
jgi:ABC-2 type transport system permease protein